MKIAIDLDKTLFDCRSTLYQLANAIVPEIGFKAKLKYKLIEKGEKHSCGVLSKVTKIFNTDSYSEIENATEIIKNWTMAGNEIVFLSSRPAWKALKNMILTWLENFDVPFTMLAVACNNKTEFCKKYNIQILVDDSVYNCTQAAKEGIYAIHYGKQNIPTHGNNLSLASSWKEINDYVEDYADAFSGKQKDKKAKTIHKIYSEEVKE